MCLIGITFRPNDIPKIFNCIGDVIVSMLASSAVDRGSSSSWVKPKTMKLVFVASPLSTHYLGERAKTDWL